MRQTPLVPLKDSIATQLLQVVFAVYLVLVVTVTLLHMLSVYVHTQSSVLQELDVIGATFKPGLEQALWEMNLTQMHSITNGIVQLPAIVGVRIEDDQGTTITQIGKLLTQQGEKIDVNGEGTPARKRPKATLFGHEFPLLYTRGDQEFRVGTVTMYSSSGVIFQRTRFGFLVMVISAVIRIVVFWILFLWVSRTKLSRPLAELTHAAGQLDLDNLEEMHIRVHTPRRDELKILEETFNAMVRKLLEARTTLYEYANELQQSRQQLQDILDNSTAIIFIKDTGGRYLLINRQYETLFHISRSEITGKTDYEVFPKEMADAFRNNDQRVISAEHPLKIEEDVPHDDGIHTYLSVKFPLRHPSGHLYAVCGIATDISERKETERYIRQLNKELEQRVKERTASLKNSEQRLKEAQHIAQLGNWDWNLRTDELFWSDETYRIFGLRPQEFDAAHEAFLHVVHPDDRDAVQHAMNNALDLGQPYSLDHRIVLPNGTVRMVHEEGEVTVDDQQKPCRALGTVQDITERKQAEEAVRASEHQLRLITDNTPAYIAYVGVDDLCYRFVNRNFAIGYALSREQIIGRHIKDLIGETNYQFALPSIDLVKTGQSASYEHEFPLKDGTRWMQVNYVPDFDEQGAVRAIVVMMHDITEQKHTEILLQQAKEAAEAASRAKSTFLANMSHELRTPLHSILGFAQRLKQDHVLTTSQHQHVDIITRNGEHLLTLLNDILDFTKIEANTLELRPSQFAFRNVLARLAEMTRLNAEHKGLTFVYDAAADLPHVVYGDQKRLRQILMNLLGNAIRFTEHGTITLTIACCRLKSTEQPENSPQSSIATLQFSIQDTGIGITAEHHESIFQPFQQADPQRLQEGSRGVGLAISQRVVNLMGGHIHVTSTPGTGSTFWFQVELPVINTPVTDTPYQAPKHKPENPPQTILATALAALPSDWLAMLEQGAEDVDPDAIADIIPHIRTRNATLADTLGHLTEEFEYDEILNLIHEARKQDIQAQSREEKNTD